MKNLLSMKTPVLALFISLVAFGACVSNKQTQPSTDYTQLVNPFIGTDFTGNTYPGAQAPFGMVQLSPDNGLPGWDRISGYFYPDSTIAGFSHTHLSGTGAGDLYDISYMPVTLPYREAALRPLKEALLGDREDACTLESFSPLQTLPMCIFCRQAAPPGSQRRLIRLGAFLRCMGQDKCQDSGSCTCWMSNLFCLSRIPAQKSRVAGPL